MPHIKSGLLALRSHATSICLLALAAVFLVQTFRYEHSIIQVHDNLDSNLIYYKLLTESGLLFSHGTIDFLGGTDRNWFDSEFSLNSLIYSIFKPLNAYFTILLLKLLVGFFSMRALLLSNLFKIQPNIANYTAFCFAILPGFPTAYLAQASIPLAILLLYRATCSTSIKSFSCAAFPLLIYPSISNLILYGLFLCASASLVALILLFSQRTKALKLIAAISVLTLGFILVNYRLFAISLNSTELTVRHEFTIADINFWKSLSNLYLNGEYHSTAQAGLLLSWLVPAVILLYFTAARQLGLLKLQNKKLLAIYVLILLSTAMAALYDYGPFRNWVFGHFPFLDGIVFRRFHYINTTFWYIAFSLALHQIYPRFKLMATALIALQVSIIALSTTAYNDLKSNIYYDRSKNKQPTFAEFYSEQLFSDILDDIDYNDEKSIAVGFHPAVLQYNNIKTIDGYLSVGSLDYKHQFRKIIAPQLATNPPHQRYYDNVGIRQYIFTDDNHSSNPKPARHAVIKQLRIDTQEFVNMGGIYVFSIGTILNAEELGLELHATYEHAKSPYHIHLYTSNMSVKTVRPPL